ncbi:S8 family serine peptidase [Paenibacillus ginsengarvi]|nr:S8 family serine peptidase [Paenibacillus ginsengarvi]
MYHWASLRKFLDVPANVTGKGVRIAIIDGDFPAHPDISTDAVRKTYLVRASDPNPAPTLLESTEGPWPRGDHGLWAAASAAGSGFLCHGHYSGVAPEADLFLVAGGSTKQKLNVETSISNALNWVKSNWNKYNIRGVLVATYGKKDTGLLPWQVDPLRVLCEEIANEGLLVMAGTGNHSDTTSGVTQAAAPSVLSVGGVIIPVNGDPVSAEPYHGSRGYTFEEKWVPEMLAPAENIVFPYGTEEQFESHLYARSDHLPKGYARINEGTSFAGPIALGVAACLWQARPEWTTDQIKAALINTSTSNMKWSQLKAGLPSIKRAIESEIGGASFNQQLNSYRTWREWREKPLSLRLQSLMNHNEETAMPILLSFLPGELPNEAAGTVKKL